MNIRDASKRSGIPSKTLRYYESIGLISPSRLDNGYRDYADDDVAQLNFVRRSRALGFSIDDCRSLLALWADTSRASADVRAIANSHLDAVEQKLRELSEMQRTLSALVSACHGNDSPECPILRDLSR
jgi:MerR family transcriptional regulator, copper efflux regulator